jgi:phage baseplate assembly protein W
MAEFAGISPYIPLTIGTFGYKLNKTYADAVKQNFRNLILTVRGERMMDPDFGVGLYSFLFEQDDDALRSSVESEILKQTERYMPFLEIHDIYFSPPGLNQYEVDGNSFYMSITYSVLPLNLQDQLDISLEED